MTSDQIHIIEVGPRDGLQNVKEQLTTEQKIAFIQGLLDVGFTDIEAGSFVRADKIPAMQGSDLVATHFESYADKLWYLAPNLKGLQSALATNARQIAFFTATSETFNTKNIGLSVSKSLDTIKESLSFLRNEGFEFINDWAVRPTSSKQLKLRLYVSTVIGCPYEGDQKPEASINIIDELMPLGFAQVSLGDTIGVGSPKLWQTLLKLIDPKYLSKNAVAMHCHDTYATALSCISQGLSMGIRSFDSSLGGLGGCPYAKGATGNLATEDLLFFLDREGFKNIPNLEAVVALFEPSRIGTLTNNSRVFQAMKAKQKKR